MKTKLLALALLAGGTMFAGPRIGVSVGIGPGYGYYGAPAYVAPAPAYAAPSVYVGPGPGYAGGYWYTVGGRRFWHNGYRVAPRYYRGYRR